MEVRNGQEVLTTGLDPLFFPEGLAFGAMPIPAGVIGDLQMAAVVALIFMPSKESGSAEFDGTHDSKLITG